MIDTSSAGLYNGEEALALLKENIYKYNSMEERQRLDELGKRLSEEKLLRSVNTRDLIGWFERYSDDGETLDGIIASVKHPGE